MVDTAVVGKRYYFVANLRADMSPKAAREYMQKFVLHGKDNSLFRDLGTYKSEVVMGAPAKCLAAVREKLGPVDDVVKLAVQNLRIAKAAPAGSASLDQATAARAEYVIIGHPFVRKELQEFAELDQAINQSVKESLARKITPILCVGETAAEKITGLEMNTVSAQLSSGLAGLSAEKVKRVMIAYLPGWAVKTGEAAKPAEAQRVHAGIARILTKLAHAGQNEVPIIYGGSLTEQNVEALVSQKDVWGGFVGRASMEAERFLELILSGF